jgi:hypothetical protein
VSEEDPQDAYMAKFSEGYDEAMRQGVGGAESVEWVARRAEAYVRRWVETAVQIEKAGTSDATVRKALDQLMTLHLDYAGPVALEIAQDITAEAVNFADALDEEHSTEVKQLRALKDKLFEQMDRALFIKEGAVTRWERLQDGFLRSNDISRMIDSLLDERDALRDAKASGHTCPPGKLVRMFDGGRQAMLCPTCDVILGYDAN